jgi:hypothetical protein
MLKSNDYEELSFNKLSDILSNIEIEYIRHNNNKHSNIHYINRHVMGNVTEFRSINQEMPNLKWTFILHD